MRISVSGSACCGKSTYVQDFLKAWPKYKLGELSYRKVLKEKNLPHSSQSNEKTQEIIRDTIIDDVCSYDKKDNVIFDRGLFDNLAYTMYLHDKGLVSDEFAKSNVQIIREALCFYDIIFFFPILDSYPIEFNLDNNALRDSDILFREETDIVMKAIQHDYLKEAGKPRIFFPNYNSPALIEIFGSREERIEMTKLYIKPNGSSYGEDESLIVLPTDNELNNITSSKLGGRTNFNG